MTNKLLCGSKVDHVLYTILGTMQGNVLIALL